MHGVSCSGAMCSGAMCSGAMCSGAMCIGAMCSGAMCIGAMCIGAMCSGGYGQREDLGQFVYAMPLGLFNATVFAKLPGYDCQSMSVVVLS